MLAAWRSRQRKGAAIGAIALVVVLLEVAKRVFLIFQGQISMGILEGLLVFMIAAGLLNGVRGARGIGHLRPDCDEVAKVFS